MDGSYRRFGSLIGLYHKNGAVQRVLALQVRTLLTALRMASTVPQPVGDQVMVAYNRGFSQFSLLNNVFCVPIDQVGGFSLLYALIRG